MIALLSYSINLFANDNVHHSSTGEFEQTDSVMIAFDDLRIVNSKLIELEYEKEINTNLRQIVANDSIIIKEQDKVNKDLNKQIKKVRLQRNICFGTAIAATIVTIFVSIFK